MCNHAVAEVGVVPDGAFAPRQSVTLDEEHSEAMTALKHARAAVNEFNADILRQLRSADPDGWRKTLPAMVNVSTWVGYDLDGRSDISWTDSFRLRLRENTWLCAAMSVRSETAKLTCYLLWLTDWRWPLRPLASI